MKKSILFSLFINTIVTLYAQDYQISFTGSGQSSFVETVEVINLAQESSLILNGTDILHLTSAVGINTVYPDTHELLIYPNPVKYSGTIIFYNDLFGAVDINVFDLTGKVIVQANAQLQHGTHTFQVAGLKAGIYSVQVVTPKDKYSKRLVSTGEKNGHAKLIYESVNLNSDQERDTKSSKSIVSMHYNDGERLLLKGISGDYIRIVSFIPDQNQNLDFLFEDCTDYENNHYAVVTIGTQTWMAENLKSTKFKDGMDIPLVTDDTAWDSINTPAYCWYKNDRETYGDTYGALYNWYTTEESKLCPAGWHTPTSSEWNDLESYLIANGYNFDGSYTGDKTALSLASTTHWDGSGTEGTPGSNDYFEYRNKTGFSALPGSFRIHGGFSSGLGMLGYWWASQAGSETAWYRLLMDDSPSLTAAYLNKKTGMSVRCLKD